MVKSVWPIKQSSVGIYSGYSDAAYDGRNRYSVYVTVSDGCRIAVDYYIPTKDGIEETKPLPVVMNFTPYQRIVYGYTLEDEFGFEIPKDLDDDELYFDDIGMEGYLELTQYGYVVALVDIRGCGASFGARITTNSRREALDGKEIVEWFANQKFCSGKVGTAGFSYTGQTQLEILSCKPNGLVASFVALTDYDKYDGWMRDGIPRAFRTEPDVDFGTDPEEPQKVIDEVTRTTVPVDDDPEKVLLRQAISEHINSGKQIPIMRDLIWRNSYWEPSGGEHWNIIGMSPYKDIINSTGAAIYCIGGVYDDFRRDTAIIYANYTGPKKMTIGPWYHMTPKVDTRWDIEMRRWFDYWLKGIDNGIMDESPVNIRVANYNFNNHSFYGPGTGYMLEKDNWPVHEGSRKTMYLNNEVVNYDGTDNGGLSLECMDKEVAVVHTADYGMIQRLDAQIVNVPNGMNEMGATFTSSPMDKDMTIIGHPMANIKFSLDDPGWMTTNYETDIFVNLCDYNPETKESFLFCSGQLRTSLRKTDKCPYDFLGLPWHRCNTGDNDYLELNKDYEVEIDLLPTSYTLKKGHCLRVSINNVLQATYYNGYQVYADDENCKRPKISIKVGAKDASRIIIPNIYN